MKDFDNIYKGLNSEQKKAVDTISGPLLVLAGPGTGKTQLLSVRAANIVRQKKALPENILILTYTNAAAKTMKERLARILGLGGYDVGVYTFHSFANSLILDSEEASNYIQERIQITDIESVKASEYILDHSSGLSDIRPFNAPYTYVREIQARISDLKREGISPSEFLRYVKHLKPDGARIEEKHIPRIKALAVVYDQYERLKEGRSKEVFDERGRYDYDDMIMIATDALGKEPVLKEKYQGQFTYLMVDEFQDTNGAQLKFLFSLMKGGHPNICCVGDDDQSIYRFQGASVANFKELKKRFKELKTISLKNNYRSAKEIIELSQDRINDLPQNERTDPKGLVPVRNFRNKSIEYREFSTEEEEMCFLVDKIKQFESRIESSRDLTPEEKENPYNNIAVLVRKRKQILRVIDAFLQAGIPYATDGKEDIRSEARVRQMLDVLELVSIEPRDFEQRDRVIYKILISDYFRIPHKDILGFINGVNKQRRAGKDVTVLSELFSGKGLTGPLKDAAAVIDRLLKSAPFKPVHTVLMDYIKEARIYGHILERYDKDDIARIRELRGLASFINMVKECDFSNPGINLKDFVAEIKTRNEHNMPIQGQLVTMTQNGVRVFTAHGSKGQEFHSVIIPFCLQDTSWPIKPMPEKIPLPPEILKTVQKVEDKENIKRLRHYDETRLFYVAVSRARSDVLFTSSPQENKVPSSFVHRLGLEAKAGAFEEETVLKKSLEKTDVTDSFAGTKDVLKDIVKDMTLNPTSLNNYLSCRRRFLYDNVLMLPSPKKQSLIFGNAVHSGLERLYRRYMKTGRFPDFQFFKDSFIAALRFQGPEKGMEIRCLEQFNGLRRFFEKASSEPVRPLGLENRMPVNIDGIVFTGKYDKLEMEDGSVNSVRVVDYKTGQPKAHAGGIFRCRSLEDPSCDDYLRQLVCYKLLYEKDKTRGDRELVVSHGVIVFVESAKEDMSRYNIKKGEPTEFKVELTEDMVDEMSAIVRNVWRGIHDLHFEKLPERDRKKCSRCEFDHICWG